MADNLLKWFCENCGTENDENYCIKCGRPKPNFMVKKNLDNDVHQTHQWKCSVCGKINSGKFCEECGNPSTSQNIENSIPDTNSPQITNLKPKNDVTSRTLSVEENLITNQTVNESAETNSPYVEEFKKDQWKCSVCGKINSGEFCEECGNPSTSQNIENSIPDTNSPQITNLKPKNDVTSRTLSVEENLITNQTVNESAETNSPYVEEFKKDQWKCSVCGKINSGEFCEECGNPSTSQNIENSTPDTNSPQITNLKPKNDVTSETLNVKETLSYKQPVNESEKTDSPRLDDPAKLVKNTPKSKNILYSVFIIIFLALVAFLGLRVVKGLPINNFDDLIGIVQTPKIQEKEPIKPAEPAEIPTVPENPESPQAPKKTQSQNPPTPSNAPVKTQDTSSSSQREAKNTLISFHENITHRDFWQAYNCLSNEWKNQISYEGWVSGFNTTVSSTVSDIKVSYESEDRVVLTYILTAVDNPGGTSSFYGTVTVIKTDDGWKIDEIMNKVR